MRSSIAATALSGASSGAERRLRTIERLTAASPTSAATMTELDQQDVAVARVGVAADRESDLAPRREHAGDDEHDDAPERDAGERRQRAPESAAEAAAERGDEEHDEPAEPHAHREHVDRVERDREERPVAGRGVARVSGCRRETDADDPAATSHHTGARRVPPTRPRKANSASANSKSTSRTSADVTEARLQHVVDDRPLDRVADARAGRVRALQHQRRNGRGAPG